MLLLQVPVIYFVLGTTQVKQSYTMDGVTAFHVSFLSLDCSQNDSHLTVFLTKGKRVFHVSILSFVHSGNGFTFGRLSYGQVSTYRPRPTSYVLCYCVWYLCVRTYVRYQHNVLLTETKLLKLLEWIMIKYIYKYNDHICFVQP